MGSQKSSADHFIGVVFNEETHGDLCFSPFGRPDTVMKLQSQTARITCPPPLSAQLVLCSTQVAQQEAVSSGIVQSPVLNKQLLLLTGRPVGDHTGSDGPPHHHIPSTAAVHASAVSGSRAMVDRQHTGGQCFTCRHSCSSRGHDVCRQHLLGPCPLILCSTRGSARKSLDDDRPAMPVLGDAIAQHSFLRLGPLRARHLDRWLHLVAARIGFCYDMTFEILLRLGVRSARRLSPLRAAQSAKGRRSRAPGGGARESARVRARTRTRTRAHTQLCKPPIYRLPLGFGSGTIRNCDSVLRAV